VEEKFFAAGLGGVSVRRLEVYWQPRIGFVRRSYPQLIPKGGKRYVDILRVGDLASIRYPKGVSREASVIMDEQGHHGYIGRQDDYLRRLRRIEGQVRGLQKMVEEEQYCIDILTQISATTSALQSVALGLLDEHLSHCVVRAAASGGPESEVKLQEASTAIARLVRS